MAETQDQSKPPEDEESPENQTEESEESEEKKEIVELPPFEIVTGDRLPSFFFNFQFKNVEYSSGRNKTFLCFIVEMQGKESSTFRGYLEDEHASAHAEDAFFNNFLPTCTSSMKYQITWYMSSSPCVACADRIVEVLRKNKNLKLALLVARIFMWEEPEIQTALQRMKTAGCKINIMRPQDFEFVWKNFVEPEEGQTFTPWEDIQENFQYYQEKLAEILH
ncbi:C-_U-editing enzyme APOBEC-2 [Microcaecilia unicolor]|uniref:mRNA(cytosine(6666)) deaminase n=1 Tax=Microcaecilia unicolor TaxID=1415580 RepID=A0A6P7ZNG3_9AMPH|nr:C->U-editing enzyme APOBEC-2 [Microcaecilia unicolor]XP_030076585.1 C->U-editing enzyme APOBEC-2 [Microcaecilia unicolor]XP_030076586.1 C->U-editing enzyme APOBEC-2 [Microcaecilia unicolor]